MGILRTSPKMMVRTYDPGVFRVEQLLKRTHWRLDVPITGSGEGLAGSIFVSSRVRLTNGVASLITLFDMGEVRLRVLHSREEIASRVQSLGEMISRDYEGTTPLLVGILKGAFVFLADLMRSLKIPVEVDFVRVASYGSSMESSGTICLTKDLEMPIEGRDVLVIEDIVDSGRTLKYLMEELERRGPKSLRCCCLLDKTHRREVDLKIDYVGFVMDEGFVVGYGLDWAEAYRHLPELCIVEQGEGVP